MPAQTSWCPRCRTAMAGAACPRCGALPVTAGDRDATLFEVGREAAAAVVRPAAASAGAPAVAPRGAATGGAPLSLRPTQIRHRGGNGGVAPVTRAPEPWALAPAPRPGARHDPGPGIVPRSDRPIRSRQRMDVVAVLALLLGLAGLGPIAVVAGLWGRSRVRHKANRKGYALATTGLWLGFLATVVYAWVAFRVAFPY
jgi:hypothetical protein